MAVNWWSQMKKRHGSVRTCTLLDTNLFQFNPLHNSPFLILSCRPCTVVASCNFLLSLCNINVRNESDTDFSDDDPQHCGAKPRVSAGSLCPAIHRFLPSPSSDNRQIIASDEPQVPVVSSIFTNEYSKITFRFGAEKMPLIKKNPIKYVMEEMALSYLGRRANLTLISDVIKVKTK
jgi:hypothetical protein